MPPIIRSVQNAKIKALLALEKSRKRKKHKLFVIEGLTELSLALEANYTLTHVFFCPDIIQKEALYNVGVAEEIMTPVSAPIFEKIAYRKTTGGVVAMAKWKSCKLEELVLQPKPLLLVLQSIEKPGNLGALLRTADATGIDAVLICDMHTDLYNPNVVRSSMGCLFTTQVVSTTSEEAIGWLQKKGIKIYCTTLQGAISYRKGNYNQPCAFIMGTESTGLEENWKSRTSNNIVIPMRGKIDSLNVSVTAGIIIFEALRQRGL